MSDENLEEDDDSHIFDMPTDIKQEHFEIVRPAWETDEILKRLDRLERQMNWVRSKLVKTNKIGGM